MKKVKIGFLGCGHMGQNAHLQHYAQLPGNCEVIAVCDTKARQAELVAQRYGVPKVYTDMGMFLADGEIEAVVAPQQFNNHVNVVPAILHAGKHVLTEKPLCVFPDNGEKLAAIAKETGKIHMVGYHKRSDPAAEYALGVVNGWKQSGEFGKMTYIRVCMPPGDWVSGANRHLQTGEETPPVPPETSAIEMDEATRKRYVAFVNYYIHQVNFMRYMLGEDYKLTYADKGGILYAAESVTGITGLLEMSPYSTGPDWQEYALACFEKGFIRVGLPAPLASQRAGTVTIYTNRGGECAYNIPVMPNICAMRNQAKNFTLAVAGEKAAPCESAEAVKDLRIALDYINMTQ